jgi:hypothetical protein
MDAERDLAAEFRRGWEWMMRLQGCVPIELSGVPASPSRASGSAPSLASESRPSATPANAEE